MPRIIDWTGSALLGLKPGDDVPVSDIVYLIYWTTPGTEQFKCKKSFMCMASGQLLNQLCQIDEQDIPF